MSDATLKQKPADELNVRLSIALNTGAPFCFLGFALGNLPGTIDGAILCTVVGLVLYSFVEYGVHRWILHGLDVTGHRNHHRNPTEPHAMLFSTGLTVHTLLLVSLSWVTGSPIAIWTVFGSALGYALFLQLHDFQHADPALSHRLWGSLHRHHMLHHEGGDRSGAAVDRGSNYGVITMIWDRIFRTYRA
jgi:sterol desaturase/sphingolipid hydroxylase (fatty acid hydroxylase superfamily)